jgi:biotin transport system substrate-specific component
MKEVTSEATVVSAQRRHTINITLTALFAALIAAGAFISIPIPGSPVPIVLQNLFILLSGMILGPLWGCGAVGLYLLAGAIGAPVFAGGTGGFVRFMGPTGGFLIGYVLVALIAGLIAGRPRAETPRWRLAIAAVLGMFMSYVPGIPWLKLVLDTSWQGAFAAGLLPFFAGDLIKALAAILIAPRLRRVVAVHLDDQPDAEA